MVLRAPRETRTEIIITGAPGTGKTTLASLLELELLSKLPERSPASLVDLSLHALFCRKTCADLAAAKLPTLCADLQQRIHQHQHPAFTLRRPKPPKLAGGFRAPVRLTLPEYNNMEACIHECTQPLLRAYNYTAKIFILLYDESRPETLRYVLSWVETAVQRYLDPDDIKPIIILLGNAINQPAGTSQLELLPKNVFPCFFKWINCSVRCQPNQVMTHVHQALEEAARRAAVAPPLSVDLLPRLDREQRRNCGICSLLGESSKPAVPGGFQAHPGAKERLVCNLSAPLLVTARRYLQVLQRIDADQTLANPVVVSNFMEDYRRFLCGRIRSPHSSAIASLGVHAVWLAHLIRPQRYKRFCEQLGSSDALPAWDPRVSTAESSYSNALSKEGEQVPLGITTADVIADRDWLETIREAIPLSLITDVILNNFMKKYERHLYLMTQYPTLRAGPPPTVDLIWHSHMLHPTPYEKDCRRLLGFELVHEPWPEEPETDVTLREELWLQEFGCSE